MPASEPQLATPRRVVVAVVGGGALVDAAVGPDADLDPLPVVGVEALLAGDRDAAQGRRVRVVGPVLDVEVAGARARSSRRRQLRSASASSARQSTTWTKAVTGSPLSVRRDVARARRRRRSSVLAAAPEVDRHRPRPLARTAAIGMCSPHQLPDFGPVGRDQHRLVPTAVRQRRRAEHPRGNRPRQRNPRHPHPRRDQPHQQQRDDASSPTHSTVPCPRSPSRMDCKASATTSIPRAS